MGGFNRNASELYINGARRPQLPSLHIVIVLLVAAARSFSLLPVGLSFVFNHPTMTEVGSHSSQVMREVGSHLSQVTAASPSAGWSPEWLSLVVLEYKSD